MGIQNEIRYLLMECVEQVHKINSLTHRQRLEVFRGLVTCLAKYVNPPIIERSIHSMSVHLAAQAIVDLTTDNEQITIFIEPCEGELFVSFFVYQVQQVIL